MKLAVNGLWPRGRRHGAKDVGKTVLGRCLALFGSVGQRAFAHSSHALECPKEVWAASSFFFPLKKEPMVLSELVEFGPCICAWIGLHMMDEEIALRSDSDSSPDLGDMWKYGCPKSPEWSGNGVEWAGSEDAFPRWSFTSTTSEISLLKSLGRSRQVKRSLFSWKIGRSGGWHSSCNWSTDLLCQEMRDACGGDPSFTVPGRKEEVF